MLDSSLDYFHTRTALELIEGWWQCFWARYLFRPIFKRRLKCSYGKGVLPSSSRNSNTTVPFRSIDRRILQRRLPSSLSSLSSLFHTQVHHLWEHWYMCKIANFIWDLSRMAPSQRRRREEIVGTKWTAFPCGNVATMVLTHCFSANFKVSVMPWRYVHTVQPISTRQYNWGLGSI